MGPFSNGEITLIAAVVSAGISGALSILTTRWAIKHGPNYEDQIEGLDEKFEGLHETIGKLAQTQEEFRKQHAEQAADDKRRFEAEEARAEQARWRPMVHISSVVEGNQQVNKLVLKSQRQFCLLEVSLLSPSGAKIFDYPMNKPLGCSTGFLVPITHESLNLIANVTQTFFQHSYFDAKLRYRVSLENGDAADTTAEVPFRAQQVTVQNTCYYKLTG